MTRDDQLNEARRVRDEVLPQAFLLLPPRMQSMSAVAAILTIGLQESEFLVRVQHGNGPAHSYWQMERGGGVKGVLTHPGSKDYALHVCDRRGVEPAPQDVWERMASDDVLGAAFARLLLWTSPHPLPGPDDVDAAWRMYADELWRPGKPHPEKWGQNFIDGWLMANGG